MPHEFDEDLSTPQGRLTAARRRAGHDQTATAAIACGLRPKDLGAHEAGTKRFIGRSAHPYGEAFKVSPQWLMFGGTDEAPPWADPTRRAFDRWMSDTGIDLGDVIRRSQVSRRSLEYWLKGWTPGLNMADLRRLTKTFGPVVASIFAPPHDPASAAETSELFSLWSELDERDKHRALAILRTLATT